MAQEKERVLHKRLVQLLRARQSCDAFLFFHIKNDIGASRGARFYDPRPLGVLSGVADFCILRNGKTYFLEIKSDKGRLSKEQRKFLVEVNRLGHFGLVGFGWEDIMDKLNGVFGEKNCSAPAEKGVSSPTVRKVALSPFLQGFMKQRPKKGFSIFLY